MFHRSQYITSSVLCLYFCTEIDYLFYELSIFLITVPGAISVVIISLLFQSSTLLLKYLSNSLVVPLLWLSHCLECSSWWDTCTPHPSLFQKAAYNLPVHQRIPTLVLTTPLHYLWCLTSIFIHWYWNWLTVLVLLHLRVPFHKLEIKRDESTFRIRIIIRTKLSDHMFRYKRCWCVSLLWMLTCMSFKNILKYFVNNN